MLDRPVIVAEVEPQHAEKRIDGYRVAAGGERLFCNSAGVGEPSRPRCGERLPYCACGAFVEPSGGCCLNRHSLLKSKSISSVQPLAGKKKGRQPKPPPQVFSFLRRLEVDRPAGDDEPAEGVR